MCLMVRRRVEDWEEEVFEGESSMKFVIAPKGELLL